MNPQILTTVRIVVDLLVRREYSLIESMTKGRRLGASDIENAISEYGRTLVLNPEESWDGVDIVQIERPDPPQFHVVVPLWTEEEGLSDLSLELLLTEISPAVYDSQILDLHVL